ncbi:MAG: S1C family serine protease [Lachnospiraceae bacterium]|nr:S1C family serine protease [Lachnospiraceae bacterium]
MGTDDNNNNDTSEYQFIKETIKERPVNKKKVLTKIIMLLISALLFGAVSSGVFILIARQFMSGQEAIPDTVNIPRDEEMVTPSEEATGEETVSTSENEAASEEASEEAPEPESETVPPAEIISYNVTEHVSLSLEDYKSFYRTLKEIAVETCKSVVTVTTVVNDTDWFDNSYENSNMVTGLIVANNGKDLLILAEMPETTADMELSVTFADEFTLPGEVKSEDPDTGLAIISVPLASIPDDTKSAIKEAELGSSKGTGIVGIPVMALGAPIGIQGSQCYGRTTSNQREISLPDKVVHVLSTDIYGSEKATGIITDYDGRVIGIISGETAMEDAPNLLTAYAISDLKGIIEKLSNGSSECYLGIYGADVTPEINEEEGVPVGLYVTKVALDSPAMTGGIQSGDVITRLGTADITSFKDYMEQMMKYQPGDEAVISVQRYSQGEFQEMTFEVEFGKAGQEQQNEIEKERK